MGGPSVRTRPQNQQLSQLIYSQVITQPVSSGAWQSSYPVNMRVANAMNIISNSFLAMPQGENGQLVGIGLTYEREAFSTSPDKATYDARIMNRVNDLFKKRQANEQNIHNSLSAQAAAQAQNQTQMMMGQNMQMRGIGQALPQGFQGLQQQMQPSLNQQGQANIGMNNPNGFPINPNPQMMQMAGQMRGAMGMQALGSHDRIKINQLAVAKMNTIPEPTRAQYRSMVQQKYGPQLLAQLQQENMDPLVHFFTAQMLQGASKGTPGMNQAALPVQAHQQRAMNQPAQQQPPGPNGEFGPFANVESIMNQQKAGLMAQEAGQMVVPASSAGRNATPQPMGSLPGPNQGAGQPTLPHQLPQQFSHQPTQQLKMDQRAAQSQAQIRAQAQAKQMQGQPGGLNGPGGASQSPAMSTLNAPVRRAPIGVGQNEGHPQMGQGNMPFGQQMMDPRYNQTGQRTPMGPNAAMNRNQFMHNILNQMPHETRQQIMSLPQDKAYDMILKWNAPRAAGAMAGRAQPQIGQIGPGNPIAQSMNQFAPGSNNLGQQPSLGMPMSQQNQMMMQQQMNKLRNPNAPQTPLDRNALMDNMPLPPKIIGQLPTTPDVKKWGQLKQWMSQRNLPQQTVQNLLNIQNVQFQSYVKSNPGFAAISAQVPHPSLPQQGIHPNGQATPQMGQPTPNIPNSNPNFTVTPQEMQNARNHERFKGLSDDKIRQLLFQMKMQSHLKRGGAGQTSGPPAQASQAAQPGHTATVPSPSQPANGAVAPPRQQNAGAETNTASPVTQGRNVKHPQNNRAPPTPATSTVKPGTKRSRSEDTAEGPHPTPPPALRQPTQPQAQPVASNAPQVPHATAEQLAAMTPERRQKYEAAVKSRQQASGNPLSEEMMRLKAIGQEQHQLAAKEPLPDIPMTPEQYREAARGIQVSTTEINKVSRLLGRWYTLTHDDERARLFFKLRYRLVKQYVDGEKMTVLKDKFSITPSDLDNIRGLLETMAREVATTFSMRKNPSQQNASEGTTQGIPPRPGAPNTQPAPLNAANLEKQTQALSKMHQRNNSRSGQPPAAPTTAQPPFSFGAQSPDGRPTYPGGPPAVTQENLQLPARKKPKSEMRAGMGINQNGPSTNASPQVQKLSSPEMSKRQGAAEARPPTSQFVCTDQYCDFRSIGFPSEEALRKHMEEEHVKPALDPMKFAADGLAKVLGLNADGKVKNGAPAGGNAQSPENASKPIQTPPIKLESVNLREAPMKRQSSMTGPKPHDLIKTIAGKSSTPKLDSNLKAIDGATPATMANGGAALQATNNDTMGTTIDPQELLSCITGFDTGGNGAILDMAVYRSFTPNDTPESSKDSAGSEPNSDLSEGVALNVTLDMGFGTWDPFAHCHEAPALDLEMPGSMPGLSFPDFTWDEVNPDFDRPFVLDTSLFSMDTS
ncbi:hypothetical protein F4802DRAFT_608558 [Xylaria palmicola]|nr:hypothetical protein F4802DRAFT_608558 [Xylaria palmicola]